jgi:hypothetical protein
VEPAHSNRLAVVVAAFVPMVLGTFWYPAALCARPWLRAGGRTTENLSGLHFGAPHRVGPSTAG